MMKSVVGKAAAGLCLALLSAAVSPDCVAQKKSKRAAEILDGSQVYVGTATAVPVESKLSYDRPRGVDITPDKTVYLYPKGQGVDQGIVENGVQVTLGPAVSNGLEGPESVATKSGGIGNITDSARIDIFLPKNPNGQMIISCPGGGYSYVSSWSEGDYLAKWLTDNGIACAVVKYRMPGGHPQAPLQDVQNAFRYCRHHAEEWGIRQIGVIGFSAGGHLASMAETMYVDEVTKPDFAVLIYPVISMDSKITHKGSRFNLIGTDEYWNDRDSYSFEEWRSRQAEHESLTEKYSTYMNVTASTPPTFIASSSYDKTVPIDNTVRFYRMLQNNKVPAELHVYPKGGHGWGFNMKEAGVANARDGLGSCRPEFLAALKRWLGQQMERVDGPKAQETIERVAYTGKPDETVLLYPEGQEVDKGIEGITLGPGESNGCDKPEDDSGAKKELKYVGDSARFDLYFAPNPNGKMVIITPGGAYWYTAFGHEGELAAEWLNEQGISAAVVKYRLPFGHPSVPLTDVQNVFRYCRHHAEEWGIEKIGIMGFSAGGHLAASASTLYTDAITRPDFAVLVYPVISTEPGVTHQGSIDNLIGKKENWTGRSADGASNAEWNANKAKFEELMEQYSLDKQVTPDTPPTFLIFSSNDYGVPPENELRYYTALSECGVPCEMHAFPGGSHGYGFGTMKYRNDPLHPWRVDFFAAVARFLQEQ